MYIGVHIYIYVYVYMCSYKIGLYILLIQIETVYGPPTCYAHDYMCACALSSAGKHPSVAMRVEGAASEGCSAAAEPPVAPSRW